MDITLGTTTRRHILSTGLFALVSALLPAAMLVPDAHAGKKKKKQKIGSVAERTDNQRIICEINGGKLAVLDGPDGGNTTECKGGTDDGDVCYNTKKATKCYEGQGAPPSAPLNDVGGPPSDGVNEQPSDGKPVGGGGAVDPIGGVEDPGDTGGGPIILFAERQASLGYRRPGKRRKQRNGKSRKR